MRHMTSLLVMAALCPLLAACATPQQRAENRENLLAAAGFTALPANTSARVASLRALPPNKVVQRTRGNTVRYVYADPLVCACLYVGDQAAYGRYRQEVFQRQLADEQAMTAQMNQMNWDVGPWGFDGGFGAF